MLSSLIIIKKNNSINTSTDVAHLPATKEYEDKKLYNLNVMLSNKDSFHLFVTHLSEEFSMECLLAYVELTQFQSFIIKNNTNNDIIKDLTLLSLSIISFPSSIPISAIIESNINNELGGSYKFKNLKNNSSNSYEYKFKAHKLFHKYIQIGSEYEINLSFQQRNDWMNMMNTTSSLWSFMQNTIDLNQLLLLIEECKKTMSKLLNHSLTRFKASSKFEAVMDALGIHHHICKQNTLSKRTSVLNIVPSFNLLLRSKSRESRSVINAVINEEHDNDIDDEEHP